jgi:hypothetical protein
LNQSLHNQVSFAAFEQRGTKKSHVEVHNIAHTLPHKTKTMRLIRTKHRPIVEVCPFPFPCILSCFGLNSDEFDRNDRLVSDNDLEFKESDEELEDHKEECEEPVMLLLEIFIPSSFLANSLFLESTEFFSGFDSFSTFSDCFNFCKSFLFLFFLACRRNQ